MRIDISNARCLVTGAAGFIGSHLCDHLLTVGAPLVLGVDSLFLGSAMRLNSSKQHNNFLFVNDDVEDYSVLKKLCHDHQIDVVFNLATKALPYSFFNPRGALVTNVNSILNLLELQREGKFKSLVHLSSSEVYGTAVYDPIDENHPINPTTTYAGGKACADIAIKTYANMFGLDIIIVRPFNNYGPRQNHLPPLAGLIPKTIYRILNGLQPEIHGDGSQARDFVYVDDTVKAIVGVYQRVSTFSVIQVGTGESISVKGVVDEICSQLCYSGEVTFHPGRNADVLFHRGSYDKLKQVTGLIPRSFQQGLALTIPWYVENFSEGLL